MKRVITYKTLEQAIEAAKEQYRQYGFYVAVWPIAQVDGSLRYMLGANSTEDTAWAIGIEGEEKA